MEKNDIIDFIKNNLNHDFDHDFNYLMKELIHYQSLRGAEQIVPKIIELIKIELGEKGIEKLKENQTKNFEKRYTEYQKAIKYITTDEHQKAEEILVKLIDTFPLKKTPEDTVLSYNFQNIIESELFVQKEPSVKKFRQLAEPVAGYYFHLALIYLAVKDYEESIKLADNILDYNPVLVEAFLLKAECELHLGRVNLFFDNIHQALKYSYKRLHLAKAYMLMGKYYLTLNNKELALALFIMSKHYKDVFTVDALIEQASKISEEVVIFDNPQKLAQVFVLNNIQLGISKDAANTMLKLMELARTKNDQKLLESLLTQYVDVTNNEEAKKELETLKNKGQH